jgi:hypothetical protein
MWEKEAARSETSETRAPSSSSGYVGSCEHAASSVSDELDNLGYLDVDDEKTTHNVSKIIAEQLVPQSLYNEFNYEPDECLSAKIKDPETRRRMRLRTYQSNMNLKTEVLAEIEALELRIDQGRRTLVDEVGEERLEKDFQTSERWKPIDQDIEEMQAKWKWVDQLNLRIAKGKHPCQDLGPMSATPVMLVEIREFYKQLVITDNQMGLDKRIKHYVAKKMNRKLAAEIQTRIKDLAESVGAIVPSPEQQAQVAAEIENEKASENLDAKLEEKKELMEKSIDTATELEAIVKDSEDFIESGSGLQEELNIVIASAESERREMLLDEPDLKSARESARDDEMVILDGTMMCRHCNAEMDLQDTTCPMCHQPNEISVVGKNIIEEQQRKAQQDHLLQLKVVTRKNIELRGQKSWRTRNPKNARTKLKKAQAAGYPTIRAMYKDNEALKTQLFENEHWDPDNEDHLIMYEGWLDLYDDLAAQPVVAKPLPLSLRTQMFENTTQVVTTQGGAVSKRTIPAKHHPEYQATLEKSDSVADTRKRRAERSKNWMKEEPPRKFQRCECGASYQKSKLDRQTVQEETGKVSEDWQGILKCQECHAKLPGSDLLYARCEDYGHKSWICIKCFEDAPSEQRSQRPYDTSVRENSRSYRGQYPQPQNWWSSHSQDDSQQSQSYSSSGWDSSYSDRAGWWVSRAETPGAEQWYR